MCCDAFFSQNFNVKACFSFTSELTALLTFSHVAFSLLFVIPHAVSELNNICRIDSTSSIGTSNSVFVEFLFFGLFAIIVVRKNSITWFLNDAIYGSLEAFSNASEHERTWFLHTCGIYQQWLLNDDLINTDFVVRRTKCRTFSTHCWLMRPLVSSTVVIA